MTADTEKTRKYYESVTEKDLCDCDCCRLYRKKAAGIYPGLSVWLSALGADIEKPFEVLWDGPDSDGNVDYPGVQYIVMGSCEEYYRTELGGIRISYTDHHPAKPSDNCFVLEAGPLKLKKDEN